MDLEKHGINPALVEDLLKAALREKLALPEGPCKPASLDGELVIDARKGLSLRCTVENLEKTVSGLARDPKIAASLFMQIKACGRPDSTNSITFDHAGLGRAGGYLAPFSSFGILNGGAATSYFDEKRNLEAAPLLFRRQETFFNQCREKYSLLPKGLCPAWFESNQDPGPDFFSHKIRKVLEGQRDALSAWQGLLPGSPGFFSDRNAPVMFQMSNSASSEALARAWTKNMSGPVFDEFFRISGRVPAISTGIQELGAALDLGQDRNPKVFSHAWGKPQTPLALPAGHGQALRVLKNVFQDLHDKGTRFVSLGNIDNIAFLPEPATLAWLALGGHSSAFEFSIKTLMDRKGGILLRLENGTLFCGDIGQAIPRELVATFENEGNTLLFNCATGHFRLDWLLQEIDRLYHSLPLRISEQQKPAGHYWQGELNLWDMIALCPRAMILGVEKKHRFIPAKIFADTMLNSGLGMEPPEPSGSEAEVWEHGKYLKSGLELLK